MVRKIIMGFSFGVDNSIDKNIEPLMSEPPFSNFIITHFNDTITVHFFTQLRGEIFSENAVSVQKLNTAYDVAKKIHKILESSAPIRITCGDHEEFNFTYNHRNAQSLKPAILLGITFSTNNLEEDPMKLTQEDKKDLDICSENMSVDLLEVAEMCTTSDMEELLAYWEPKALGCSENVSYYYGYSLQEIPGGNYIMALWFFDEQQDPETFIPFYESVLDNLVKFFHKKGLEKKLYRYLFLEELDEMYYYTKKISD